MVFPMVYYQTTCLVSKVTNRNIIKVVSVLRALLIKVTKQKSTKLTFNIFIVYTFYFERNFCEEILEFLSKLFLGLNYPFRKLLLIR